MEVLRAQRIVKNYQDANSVLNILKDIDFSVNKADLVAIRGTSGSGKVHCYIYLAYLMSQQVAIFIILTNWFLQI